MITEEKKVESTGLEEKTVATDAPKVQATETPSMHTSLSGPFPEELNRWNWGAFFLTWIWAIGHSTWIGLLALISPISLIMAIILGIKGNEWAWNNRKFENIDQFKAVQKKWAAWGLALFLVSIVLMFAIMASSVMLGLSTAREKSNQAAINANTYMQEQEAQFQEEMTNTNSFLNE